VEGELSENLVLGGDAGVHGGRLPPQAVGRSDRRGSEVLVATGPAQRTQRGRGIVAKLPLPGREVGQEDAGRVELLVGGVELGLERRGPGAGGPKFG
jgi:hypothetical protein